MGKSLARPIKTARDHKNAAAIASTALEKAGREPEAERRLKALLDAMERFDGDGEEEGGVAGAEEFDSSLRRRWSDDA